MCRGQKFHSSARNYEQNQERTSNTSQSTRPTGRVLWEKLLWEVISHITPLCSLLHTLLKDKCMCLQDKGNCESVILQDKCNIKLFLSPDVVHILLAKRVRGGFNM